MDGYVLSLVERAASGDTFLTGQCFACGGEPTTGQGEHVIPGWLQRRFNLYDKRLTLLNGTFLPYRSLTVPCCEGCNNGFLRNLENSVLSLVENQKLEGDGERLILSRWICKVLIGILTKESNLPLNRASPEYGKIIPSNFLEEFLHAQIILQSSRKATKFFCLHGSFPFTIYTYKIFEDRRFGQFDFSTHIFGQSVAIRVGKIGAIFVNDGGLQLVAGSKGPLALDGYELHPLQFSEVAARVHYKASLRDATHVYASFETPDELAVHQQAVRPFTNILVENDAQRIFRPWDDIECARFIERYRPVDWGPVYDPKTATFSTTLMDHNGKLPAPTTIAGT